MCVSATCEKPTRGNGSSRVVMTLAATIAVSAVLSGQTPRFYSDDPLMRVEDTEDASNVRPKSVNLVYDEAINLFGRPGDSNMNRRAMSINTIDEVPDSSWFTNRIGARAMTVEEVAKGPDTSTGPAPGPWTVVAGKSDGITPGFTILDTAGDRWFIKFDPPKWPEMASGAEAAATKLFHALGYNVPENHVARLRPETLVLNEKSRMTGADGAERRLNQGDIDRLLRMAAQDADGGYRVTASKAVAGKPVGPFLYVGTRPDDPNDIVPHEHRRELRAIRVFAAWTNHVDSKAINSLDTLVTVNGRAIVKHHLIDFGSTLGSASIKAREFDEGHHYIYDPGETAKGAFSLGFYVPSFHLIDYPKYAAVGHFAAEGFHPPDWKPRVPNPAFLRARPDDTFWAARRVTAFTDDMIRAAVKTGRYSDAAAEKHIADTLIARRDAIGWSWLTNVNPVIGPALDASGNLTFQNAAVAAGVAKPPASYHIVWQTFDNASGATSPIGQPTDVPDGRASAPAGLPSRAGAFVRVDISAVNPPVPSWTRPVHAYFRRGASAWTLVGFERLPDGENRNTKSRDFSLAAQQGTSRRRLRSASRCTGARRHSAAPSASRTHQDGCLSLRGRACARSDRRVADRSPHAPARRC